MESHKLIVYPRSPRQRRELTAPPAPRRRSPPARPEEYAVRFRPKRRRRSVPILAVLIPSLLAGLWLGWTLRGLLLPQAAAPPASDRADAPGQSSAPSAPQPPPCPDWITQSFLTLNPYSRPGTPLEAVNGVVVHYVGNPGTTARQNRSYFQNLAATGETYASSHFLIGMDGEIIQNIPLDEIAYCSNTRNDDTISIECCHPESDGAFTRATYDSLVRLVKWLREYYGFDTSGVIRHYDVVGKECPRYFVRHPEAWEEFLADLGAS